MTAEVYIQTKPEEITALRLERARDLLLDQLMDPTVFQAKLEGITPLIAQTLTQFFESEGWRVTNTSTTGGENHPYGDGRRRKQATVTIFIDNEGNVSGG